jgi:hypothetical protein
MKVYVGGAVLTTMEKIVRLKEAIRLVEAALKEGWAMEQVVEKLNQQIAILQKEVK